ncbi:LOW QUALITY PROTEIN: hypothetical protein MAR_027658 [Mya arenaria]|uniref:Endonuclease/exonuclease/phosphatase domain-containing protein n=1 Tax=Mya arenaria TaxID=6604 RepID=A0ABY7EY81_MYAAR|nr:LOW QUALITY PROTEIN: hypothetical protein MAR_027658 [Mya arenaria]
MTLTNTSVLNNNSLRVCTWNVRGVMSSAASLSNLLLTYQIDIAFITEQLFDHSKYFFDTIQNDYRNITICDQNFHTYNNLCCGKGGVSIMYKSNLDFSVKHINESINDIIFGMEIDCRTVKIFAFCIYMPSGNYANDVFDNYMNSLYAIYDTFSEYGIVMFLGDMNADIVVGNNQSNFRNEVFTNCLRTNDLLTLVHFPLCKGPRYIYTTMESMLDHIIISNRDKNLIECVNILDDVMFNVSDHLPVFAIVKVPVIRIINENVNRHIPWQKINQTHISEYQAKQARRVWFLEGQPRGWHNESYANYKHCKQNFVTTQKIAIENYFNSELIEAAECDSRLFWSLIKSRKNKRPSACTHLFYKNTSVREPGDILKVFTNYFCNVYSPLQCEHFDNDFKKLRKNTAKSIPEINPTITSETIKTYIKTLKRGKASSYDAIFNEHLIYGDSLERSGQGLNVINVITSNTTLADDIALAAISPNGLLNLLNITYDYICNYRYMINSTKSFVMVSVTLPQIKRTLISI